MLDRKNKNRLIRIAVSLLIFLPVFILDLCLSLNEFLVLALTLCSYLIVGYDVILKSLRNMKNLRFLDENFLMLVATVGAFAVREYLEAVAVMIFYQIGEFFQDYAVARSRKSIANLMDIRPESATVVSGEEEKVVDPEEIEIGDIIRIKAGEKIPVDGIVLNGTTNLDMKALTGESLPKEVAEGDEVLSGSINMDAVIEIRATKPYFDSTVAKILDLVQNVSGKKAKSENFITKFAAIYTPAVVLGAILLAVIPPCVDGLWQQWIFRALTFLVVSCPCALVISVPLSFFSGIGGASKEGILIKGGNYVEALNKANIFVFDKTGTLTKGEFEDVEVCAVSDSSEEEVLRLAAAVEKSSNHPIARSILRKVSDLPSDSFSVEEVAGCGLIATSEEMTLLVGNSKLLEQNGISFEVPSKEGSVVYVARNQKFLGSIVIADVPKEESYETIRLLNQIGKTVMLTGDSSSVATNIAGRLGIQEVHSELLPQDKVKQIEEIISSKKEKDVVCFVGDGINDAPVLMRSDIGISMGGIGSDSAIEASDVVLMYDRLDGILTAKRISKKTITIVWENIVFALGIKLLVLILSALGYANMWMAIFADVGVAVLAILNAMRCLKIKNKKR